MTINLAKNEVFYGDISLELTKTEFMLLATLSSRPGKTFTKEELYYRILEFDSDTEIRVITQYVYQLRNKLKECNINPIKNIWGIGYRWAENQ